jgi:hypothetical protein
MRIVVLTRLWPVNNGESQTIPRLLLRRSGALSKKQLRRVSNPALHDGVCCSHSPPPPVFPEFGQRLSRWTNVRDLHLPRLKHCHQPATGKDSGSASA